MNYHAEMSTRIKVITHKLAAKVETYTRHPAWTIMRAVGRVDAARRAPIWFSRSFIASSRSSETTVFPELDVNAAVASLERDGLFLGLRLPDNILHALREYASGTACYGDRDLRFPFLPEEREVAEQRFGRTFLLGTYYNTLDCATIAALATDPGILRIAEAYLHGPAVLQGTVLWWSLPAKATAVQRSQAAQMYHFDLDDYRFVKFFFYLTDVDESLGPHVCVRGTHQRKRVRHQIRLRRRTDAEIIRDYGADRVVEICGPAGFGFAEDTRCFHKGTPPRSGDRLVLQFEFARNDYQLQHDHRPEVAANTTLLSPDTQ